MTITGLLPTYCRYPYLRQLFEDLAAQTRPIDELLIIDQSPPEARETAVYEEFGDRIPLRVLYLPVPRGTCVARNLALTLVRGDYILFLDDDIRFEPDYIEVYERLAGEGYDVIHGGVRFRDDPLYEDRLMFDDPVQQLIASPNTTQSGGTIGVAGGNALVKTSWALAVKGFNRHYDNGMCDDWDFGMKLFRAGAKMIYHPEPAIRHLKAPSGGRRGFFVKGWGRWLGNFRSFSPSWLAPRFYFYSQYLNRKACRRLEFWMLLEIFKFEYRLFRYPWGVPIAIVWWFMGVSRARKMEKAGVRTLGTYPQPDHEDWCSAAWRAREGAAPATDAAMSGRR